MDDHLNPNEQNHVVNLEQNFYRNNILLSCARYDDRETVQTVQNYVLIGLWLPILSVNRGYKCNVKVRISRDKLFHESWMLPWAFILSELNSLLVLMAISVSTVWPELIIWVKPNMNEEVIRTSNTRLFAWFNPTFDRQWQHGFHNKCKHVHPCFHHCTRRVEEEKIKKNKCSGFHTWRASWKRWQRTIMSGMGTQLCRNGIQQHLNKDGIHIRTNFTLGMSFTQRIQTKLCLFVVFINRQDIVNNTNDNGPFFSNFVQSSSMRTQDGFNLNDKFMGRKCVKIQKQAGHDNVTWIHSYLLVFIHDR